jgi:hypothetical protein
MYFIVVSALNSTKFHRIIRKKDASGEGVGSTKHIGRAIDGPFD